MNDFLPWLTLIILGLFHGINPAMGWLFAVALGLQSQRRSTVLYALVPLALGHAVSIAMTVVLVGGVRIVVAPQLLRLLAGLILISFGIYKFFWRGHPRWVGMHIGSRELALWSFLMSMAHGAGLMLVPVLLRLPNGHHALEGHAAHMSSAVAGLPVAAGYGLLAVVVHTLAMFATMGVVAVVVFEKLGLSLLRRGWVNLDLLWAGALVVVGALTLAVY